MSTVRKNITLTEKQAAWVKLVMADGGYTNESEYFRELIRRDQELHGGLGVLRAAVQKGIDSGVHDGDAVAEVRAELGLPKRHG